MGKVKRPPNYQLFRKPRTQAIRELNNIFVLTGIASNAVDYAHRTLKSGSRAKLRFSVPTLRNEKVVVARERSEILSLLEQAGTRDLFSQALVPAVAVTESYLADMLALVLRAFSEKLGMKEKKIDLALILEAESLEQLFDRVILNQVHSVFYAAPIKYFKYVESTLAISLPGNHKEAYSEIKATRDIYVHNGGIANRIYIQKAGPLARAKEGEPLPLDRDYFSSAISSMKAVVNSVYRNLLKKYGRSKELAA